MNEFVTTVRGEKFSITFSFSHYRRYNNVALFDNLWEINKYKNNNRNNNRTFNYQSMSQSFNF